MRKQVIALIALLLLGFGPEFTVQASGQAPRIAPIYTVEELQAWYGSDFTGEYFALLKADLVIDRPISFTGSAGVRDIAAIGTTFRIVKGGSLTLDDSRSSIQGPGTLVIVEEGGALILENGGVYGAPGTTAVVVEKGGKLTRGSNFILMGEIKDDREESLPPPQIVGPPAANTCNVLSEVVDYGIKLACMQGEMPELEGLSQKGTVYYLSEEGVKCRAELPLVWEFDKIDLNTPGTYTVQGIFTQESLEELNLSNPNGLTATLELAVLKAEPISAIRGDILSVGKSGDCTVRLILPAVPKEAKALYVYRSADGKVWESAKGGVVDGAFTNFLPYVNTRGKNTYVAYRYKTDYKPIFLRVEVVGSFMEGTSETLKLELPPGAKPGEGIHTGGNKDDDSSGGNRGGGGQSEEDRDIPTAQKTPVPEEKPAGNGEGGIKPPVSTAEPLGPTAAPKPELTPSPEAMPGLDTTPEPEVPLEPEATPMPDAPIQSEETSQPEETSHSEDISNAEEASDSEEELEEESQPAVGVLGAVESPPPSNGATGTVLEKPGVGGGQSSGIWIAAGATALAVLGLYCIRRLYQAKRIHV